MIAQYLTEANGRWIGRLVYIEDGRRRERKRTLGLAHPGPGRPKAGTLSRRQAMRLLADERLRLEAELAHPQEQRSRGGGMLADTAPAWLDGDEPPPPDEPVQAGRRPPLRTRRGVGPRERAALIVLFLGVPLLVVFAIARIAPDVLWFDELRQPGVFTGIATARVELFLLAGGAAALALWANLAIAVPRSGLRRTRITGVVTLGAALITASFFASSASGAWQTFLLWRHRQSFGVSEPLFGKDVGYYVFSLPFERAVTGYLLWLVVLAVVYAALVYRAGGALGLRPRRATAAARTHLGTLVAILLLVVAWRLRLERYMLELGQPSARDSRSFAGAGYVDVHVRSPLLLAASVVAVVLAVACLVAPRYALRNRGRSRLLVAVPSVLGLGVAVAIAVAPPLVQRFVVDPSPLSRERPFLSRSIAATRGGLGLAGIRVRSYAPTGRVRPAEVSRARRRLADVQVWDTSMLQQRARQLVTDTPYYDPERPTVEPSGPGGRGGLTVASTRELDLRPVLGQAGGWGSDRLAYTHGLGQIRFSGTAIGAHRQPRLLDGGLGLRQPRIYFGNLPRARTESARRAPKLLRTTERGIAGPPWVVANTRLPEVDAAASLGAPASSYHYDGKGGIRLSNWFRRAAFALDLASKDLLLSHTITSASRILLHRDVRDRLQTLAPFIHWDQRPAALRLHGRIVFAVAGYTTSDRYPGAGRVELGGARVDYARASVLATVDAFSGRVEVYRTDTSDPIARAWDEAFPGLFRAGDELPRAVRGRLRYPRDLFRAQATAYERFHTTSPDEFASDSDVWSRPIALAGPVEVAGNVDFDQSDEDDLRLTMRPAYTLAPPPGRKRSRLVLETYYSPRRGQNLVATLSGWLDADGRPRLAARSLPRDSITPGPAQVSRQVFATSRVNKLLGLSNREVRDLDKSSIDSVVLGQPRLLFLRGGPIQIQSLFEGSRGAAAARLIGVTAFVNGRAGLGSGIQTAVRHALHEPPTVSVARPHGPVYVGGPVELHLAGTNARRAAVTIAGPKQDRRITVGLRTGKGELTWVPHRPGRAAVRVEAEGLDGSSVVARTAFPVLSRPPRVRFVRAPAQAVVGRPVRVPFKVAHGNGAVAEVAGTDGVEFTRRYLIRKGTGFVEWTPATPGRQVLRVRARGGQGQSTSATAHITVKPAPPRVLPPSVTLVAVPEVAKVRRANRIAFRARNCVRAVAQIDIDGERHDGWRFRCGAGPIRFTWTPPRPGSYLLTVSATDRNGATNQTLTRLTARRGR